MRHSSSSGNTVVNQFGVVPSRSVCPANVKIPSHTSLAIEMSRYAFSMMQKTSRHLQVIAGKARVVCSTATCTLTHLLPLLLRKVRPAPLLFCRRRIFQAQIGREHV